ncbi:hypothetical protein B0J15DRAFT_567079 [Fusarium solani]|uniref:Uncharacterized protein n=1 Tax=Fusarium solani TaxID=169388 RepID=A0A9P9RCH0_FUSSL|nr:uncharacterized protein B0J15DRAFT_567079 [Fusarium solani]KAH7273744.1 hypothetical protein B0J15DRAFT_567079 [Fusarium solani]
MNTIAQGVESMNKALPQVLSKLENLDVVGDSLLEKKVPARFINVSYHRVKGFVGRAEDLMTLKHHLLDKPQGAEARYVALRGLLGQEKPEMMLKIKRCFPVARNASVLITTRRQNAQDFVRLDGSVNIENMEEEDAVELLLQDSKSGDTKNVEPQSKLAVRSIVSQLWMNPLAIVQAGLYIHRSRLDFTAFLERCKDQYEILSDRLIATDCITNLEGPEMAHVLSVYTTWDLSIRQVKNAKGNGPRAHKDDLLNIIAFKSSSSFSESRFMAEQLGAFLAACLSGWDSRIFGDILTELYDIGLAQQYDIGKDGFYHGVMHGIVQDVARLRLAQAARNEYENLHLDLVFHSEQPTSVAESFKKDIFYETTGNWLNDVAESWAMPPWEEQVGQFILDMASSEMGYGFPELRDNRGFARAIEELNSEVGMFA